MNEISIVSHKFLSFCIILKIRFGFENEDGVKKSPLPNQRKSKVENMKL